jgi:hypothetical protein
VCLPVRLLLAVAIFVAGYYSPSSSSSLVLPTIGVLAAAIAVNFAVQIVRAAAGWKTHGAFGGRVWWGHLRPIHVLLWATVSGLALHRDPRAGFAALADVGVGVLGGVWHFWG